MTRCKLVGENQSVYIPLGAVHRMENPGKVPMVLIEVQTGSPIWARMTSSATRMSTPAIEPQQSLFRPCPAPYRKARQISSPSGCSGDEVAKARNPL